MSILYILHLLMLHIVINNLFVQVTKMYLVIKAVHPIHNRCLN